MKIFLLYCFKSNDLGGNLGIHKEIVNVIWTPLHIQQHIDNKYSLIIYYTFSINKRLDIVYSSYINI